jgi:tetratricopeptide (TPR) repeat protein
VSVSRRVTLVAACLLLCSGVSSIFLLQQLDRVRSGATLQEFLYISSPKMLKRMSLGYEGLLADIYWTRAVQYYGGTHYGGGGRYELLWPLLNITTQLDPHIVPAYEYGATFLTARPPTGAGMPQRAVELMEYGIRNNPDDWHLYNNLGFIYYMDLKDYPKASRVFLEGSEKPNAHPVMRILAAQAAQHGGETQTAAMLWETMLETTHDRYIREDAQLHLRALRVDSDVNQLERLAEIYREKAGHLPQSFLGMEKAGLLRGVPVDPLGNAYRIGPDGHILVADPDALPFITKGLPPGYTPKPFAKRLAQ